MNGTNDALARAIDYLGAVPVCTMDPITASQYAPGERTYVYVFRCDNRWRATTALDVLPFEEVAFAYWLGAFTWPLPAWWSLEQRFAYRHPGKQCGTGKTTCQHRDKYCFPYSLKITASLETGEEVTA